MTYFDEYGQYWGDQQEPLIGTDNERLTARSVKIFADGQWSGSHAFISCLNVYSTAINILGALRTGGAAVSISILRSSAIHGLNMVRIALRTLLG